MTILKLSPGRGSQLIHTGSLSDTSVVVFTIQVKNIFSCFKRLYETTWCIPKAEKFSKWGNKPCLYMNSFLLSVLNALA